MRRSPIRRNSIPGSRASLWLSRWRQLCAGPRKPRENPSLTLLLRVPRLLRRPPLHKPACRKPRFRKAESLQQDLPRHEAARPPRRPGPRKFRLPMPRSWAWNRPRVRSQRLPRTEETEIKRIEDPSASDGWDSHSASAPAEAPAFTSLDDDPQTSDSGGSKKTVLIAVLVLGLAAAGYFGWTKMQSAHPQPAAPQSAVPASPETACPAAAAHRFEPRDPTRDGRFGAPQPEPGLSGTTVVPLRSKPSAAVIAEGPGAKTPAPAKATPAEDETTVVKPPATEKTEPPPALMVQNGSSRQPKPEPEAQEAGASPGGNQHRHRHQHRALSLALWIRTRSMPRKRPRKP